MRKLNAVASSRFFAPAVVFVFCVLYFAPVARRGVFETHPLTSQLVSHARDPHWHVWIEGWHDEANLEKWDIRRLRRSQFRPVSATLGNVIAGNHPYQPGYFFALLLAMHAASAAVVCAIGRRLFGLWPGLAAALVFAVHPSAMLLVSTGKFVEFSAGAFFALLFRYALLRFAGVGSPPVRAGLAAALVCLLAAIWSEESFVGLVLVGTLSLRTAEATAPGITRRGAPWLFGVALVGSGAQLVHWVFDERHYDFRNWTKHPVTAAERFSRCWGDFFLHTRKTFNLYTVDTSPIWNDSARHDPHATFGPLWIVLTIVLVVGLAAVPTLARKSRRVTVALLASIPIMWIEPVADRMFQEFSRWGSLRQSYLSSAMMALFVAFVVSRLLQSKGRPLCTGLAAALVVSLVSWQVTLSAAVARKEGRAHTEASTVRKTIDDALRAAHPPRGSHVFFFEFPRDLYTQTWAQLAVSDPSLKATIITRFDAAIKEDYRARGANKLIVRRANGSPFPEYDPHAADLTPDERIADFMVAGGRRNFFPILEPLTPKGARFELELIPGTAVTIDDAPDGRPTALELSTPRSIRDEATVMLVYRGGGYGRLRCEDESAPCEIVPL